ncbi:Rapid alkalinization factor [Carex littledalei]|uniref:Rapid alkalinization factor n=1 Tax=Carex littledalei TaxID=544730 RepID=A0A833R5H0_9POAL|nr:Rapid alkalinization factor [Carex littledalei]
MDVSIYTIYIAPISLSNPKHLTFLSSCPPPPLLSLSAVTLAAIAIAIAMARLSLLFPLLLLLLSLSSPSLALHSDLPLSAYGLSVSSNSRCSGSSLGECSQDELDDPTTRRFLAGNSPYISYAALRRDSVPCSRRGASYYNCRPGAQANPYRRGCTAITRCRG